MDSLAFQGFPDELLAGSAANASDRQYQDLAGNAFPATCCLAVMLALLAHTPVPQTVPESQLSMPNSQESLPSGAESLADFLSGNGLRPFRSHVLQRGAQQNTLT